MEFLSVLPQWAIVNNCTQLPPALTPVIVYMPSWVIFVTSWRWGRLNCTLLCNKKLRWLLFFFVFWVCHMSIFTVAKFHWGRTSWFYLVGFYVKSFCHFLDKSSWFRKIEYDLNIFAICTDTCNGINARSRLSCHELKMEVWLECAVLRNENLVTPSVSFSFWSCVTAILLFVNIFREFFRMDFFLQIVNLVENVSHLVDQSSRFLQRTFWCRRPTSYCWVIHYVSLCSSLVSRSPQVSSFYKCLYYNINHHQPPPSK